MAIGEVNPLDVHCSTSTRPRHCGGRVGVKKSTTSAWELMCTFQRYDATFSGRFPHVNTQEHCEPDKLGVLNNTTGNFKIMTFCFKVIFTPHEKSYLQIRMIYFVRPRSD